MSEINLGYLNGLPVRLDRSDTINGSVVLIGASGSGKTVEMQRLACEIVESGGNVLIISQHGTMGEDQIFPYYKGKIDQSAKPTTLYTKPETKFAATFIGHYNVLSGERFAKICGEKIDSDDIAFRPEIIQISNKPIESENCYQMKGRISVSLPHGNILSYAVDCGGEQVDVDVLFTGTVPFETYTDVYLSVKKDQCIYL